MDAKPPRQTSAKRRWVGGAVLLLVGLLLAWWLLTRGMNAELFTSGKALEETARALGAAGPLLVIALIAAAIVVTPLPSAPVALTAGALYGHYWGTLYIVLGAQLGATLAFLIARYFREGPLKPFVEKAARLPLLGNQNTLTATVLVTRLLPFLSFDLISYAAGLSVLGFGRFSAATLLGILPVSFALAHLGREVREVDGAGAAITLAIIASMVVAGFLLKRWFPHWSGQAKD